MTRNAELHNERYIIKPCERAVDCENVRTLACPGAKPTLARTPPNSAHAMIGKSLSVRLNATNEVFHLCATSACPELYQLAANKLENPSIASVRFLEREAEYLFVLKSTVPSHTQLFEILTEHLGKNLSIDGSTCFVVAPERKSIAYLGISSRYQIKCSEHALSQIAGFFEVQCIAYSKNYARFPLVEGTLPRVY